MHRLCLAQLADDRCGIPGRAVCIGVVVIKHEAVGEIERRPQPIELRRTRRGGTLRIGQADGAHAPGTVAGAQHHAVIDVDAPVANLDHAFICTVLRQPRVIQDGAGALAECEAWFFHRLGTRMERHIGA